VVYLGLIVAALWSFYTGHLADLIAIAIPIGAVVLVGRLVLRWSRR
jgi:hypothetical protein